MAIDAKPATIKIPRLLSDVTALNNNMPPTNPRNNVAVPAITGWLQSIQEIMSQYLG